MHSFFKIWYTSIKMPKYSLEGDLWHMNAPYPRVYVLIILYYSYFSQYQEKCL